MNNEEARIFIRSYLDFVSKMHVGKEGKDPIPPLSKAFRAKIHTEFDMDDDKARACRKFGRQQIKKSIALAQEGLLLQSIDKAQRAMFLRPDDPKPLVMLMRLYMPKYRNEPDKAKFYAQHVLRLDPGRWSRQLLALVITQSATIFSFVRSFVLQNVEGRRCSTNGLRTEFSRFAPVRSEPALRAQSAQRTGKSPF